jgi:hypothetical protein
MSGEGSPCGLQQAPNSAAKKPPFIAESHSGAADQSWVVAIRDRLTDGACVQRNAENWAAYRVTGCCCRLRPCPSRRVSVFSRE